MKALAYGKVDAIFNNLISGQKYIKKGGYSNIEVIDEISIPKTISPITTITNKEENQTNIF